MFTADAIIDAVQTGKKTFVNTFVNTFVSNETAKESMIKFIDAQADYTKKAAKVGMDTATTLTSEMVKQVEAVAKFDYAKAAKDVLDAFTPKTAKK
jgi:KaiC/GvpD/RAD55 family RecA-like ATPase